VTQSYQTWMGSTGFGPNWMHEPVGNAYWGVVGAMIDQQVARMKLAVRCRYPLEALAAGMSDALDQQGKDCLLPRGGTTPGGTDESDAAYAARLLAKWDTWAQAGKPLGLLLALKAAGFPMGAGGTPSATTYYLQSDGSISASVPGSSGTLTANVGSFSYIENAAGIIAASAATGVGTWWNGQRPITVYCRIDPATIPGGYTQGYQLGCELRRGVGGTIYGQNFNQGAIPTDGSWAAMSLSLPVSSLVGPTTDTVQAWIMATGQSVVGNGAHFQIGYGGTSPTTVSMPFGSITPGTMLINHLGMAYLLDGSSSLVVTQPCASCFARQNLQGTVPSPPLTGFTLDCRDQFFSHYMMLFAQPVTGLDNTAGNTVKACLNQTVARWRCAGAIYNGAAIVPTGAKVWGWPPTTRVGDAGLTVGTNGATWIDPF
jgi:hypothetical protein